MMNKLTGIAAGMLLLASGIAHAQKSENVFVDKNGIMRWSKSKEEVHGFGVNYTVPFAHAYRSAKKMGIDPQKVIDDDVYHFARLGFDAYRVHVWDTEISDTVGNLLNNDHLKLFDYMLKKMKERGMKFILTPIAYWGNGYPEREEDTPGFAHKYGKDNCLTNEDAIKAQETYLFQFLNHVNPYTGVAYKDDPDIVAFEICNEPHHREPPAKVTAFIARLVKSMRNTGCKKPILYNISHGIHLVDAYFDAGIQGGTFQWYPTGLGAQEELGGNLLPNVDRYAIPFADNPRFKKGAKIVYEFDAADVGRSYIYPAIARSFRTAGIQWATHFAYDPTFLAYANTEYNTHYMNLVYAPQKALSLKIASEVFHNIPVYKSFGAYPADTLFDSFHVSYKKDLAEMMTEKKFIYTNNTDRQPSSPGKLEEIAGFGNSAVVKYEGRGAYFLDRIANGVWRLEVMPDAVWVKDPFGRNSLNRKVAVVNWHAWPMTIDLPDLGEGYAITTLNEGNTWQAVVDGKSITIMPGTYLLVRKGVTTNLKGSDHWKNITLNDFAAPETTVDKTYVLHSPDHEISDGESYTIKAIAVSANDPQSVEVSVFAGFRPRTFKMERTSDYNYVVTLPQELIREGILRYYITVNERGTSHTFPSGVAGSPGDWDFGRQDAYEVNILPKHSPVYIFNAMTDHDRLSRVWSRTQSLVPVADPGKAELQVNVEKLFTADPENKNAEQINDYSMRFFFGKKVQGRRNDLNQAKNIIFHGHALNNEPCKIQLALITKDAVAYGGVVTIDVKQGDYVLPLSDLKEVKLVTLPRPYPTFLPYYFKGNEGRKFDMKDVETLQISIGPGIPQSELENKQGIALESIRLE